MTPPLPSPLPPLPFTSLLSIVDPAKSFLSLRVRPLIISIIQFSNIASTSTEHGFIIYTPLVAAFVCLSVCG
jgi:hypothetical protein